MSSSFSLSELPVGSENIKDVYSDNENIELSILKLNYF